LVSRALLQSANNDCNGRVTISGRQRNVGDVIRSLHGAGAFMIITLTIVAEEDP
jgi:hypothetical protein